MKLNKKIKFKNKKIRVITKLVFLIAFIIAFTILTNNIKNSYVILKYNQKDTMRNIQNNINIRESNFYITTPEIPYIPIKSTEENCDTNNIEKDLNEIIIESENRTKLDENLNENIAENDKEKTYYIQIAVYRDERNANECIKSYKEYNPEIMVQSINNVKYYKIIINNFNSMNDAEIKRNEIIQKKKIKEIPLIRLKI